VPYAQRIGTGISIFTVCVFGTTARQFLLGVQTTTVDAAHRISTLVESHAGPTRPTTTVRSTLLAVTIRNTCVNLFYLTLLTGIDLIVNSEHLGGKHI